MRRHAAVFVTGMFLAQGSFAGVWSDLWFNKDQQAQQLMRQGQFAEAKAAFQRPDWQAAASYRAGDYEKAAQLYEQLNTKDGFYNAGNAYAHQGQFEKALAAYDKALKLSPNDEDARFNRKLVEDLMKQDKEKRQNQSSDEQQQKQKQDQSSSKEKQQSESGQNNQSKPDSGQQEQQSPQSGSDKQKKSDQSEPQAKQDEAKPDAKNKNKQTNEQPKASKDPLKTEDEAQNSQASKEEKQAKEQWLRLIPDDPGGLLREKFLRDHLRRKHGWDQ